MAQSAAALGGDPTILALVAELHEMRRFVSNGNSYARSGRAFMSMLSGICMHTRQRANMKRTSSCQSRLVALRLLSK